MQAAVTSPDASRYVFKNESIPPFSPYQVKVGVYNNKGESPFSPVTTIYSAEEGGRYVGALSLLVLRSEDCVETMFNCVCDCHPFLSYCNYSTNTQSSMHLR